MRSSQSRNLKPRGKEKGSKSLPTKKSKKSGSFTSNLIEFVILAVWLLCTGYVGYFMGRSPGSSNCPTLATPEVVIKKPTCVHGNSGSGLALGAVDKKEGFTYDELKRMWTCSQAKFNFTQANQQIYPKEGNMDKTKWKSIISVEPKAFFDKYLTQYPADMRAVQPVAIFSHKPLNTFEEVPEVCKVLDIAIVPDVPGVCVAVTETYHDVASYHMLHADKQPDGSFALTSNHIKERILPEEDSYAAARTLLLGYFDHVDYVSDRVKSCPRFSKGRVAIGVVLESLDEVALFKNSLLSATKQRISYNKYCVFTTSKSVYDGIQEKGLKVIHLSEIETFGQAEGIDAEKRTNFLQAWLAFAVANGNNKMLWQSPGTVWLGKPDDIITSVSVTETLFAFKGRKDPRAAPFYISTDFFSVTGNERAVHLMHELMLHFDLAMAWDSFDAEAAYRLSENNAR